jgi:FAD:protein FMN transferase
LALAACGPDGGSFTRTVELPFARCVFTMTAGRDDAAISACTSRISEVFRELDMYREDSDLAAINRAAGRGSVTVSADTAAAVAQALDLARDTDGRFDPTVAPLTRLWGISGEHPRVPGPAAIAGALAAVDWQGVVVDGAALSVGLARPGMALDLGSVLKGYASVETGKVLAARGIASAIVDIGGSIVAVGEGPRGRPWRVGLQEPGAPRGTYVGLVTVQDEVVNTSGLYEQYFVANGRRYAHIFDTATGYPVDNGVEAVTVIRDRKLNADGPSLAILVSGAEAGLALAKRLGVDAVIIGSDRTIRMTDGVRRRFTLLDRSYSVAR